MSLTRFPEAVSQLRIDPSSLAVASHRLSREKLIPDTDNSCSVSLESWSPEDASIKVMWLISTPIANMRPSGDNRVPPSKVDDVLAVD